MIDRKLLIILGLTWMYCLALLTLPVFLLAYANPTKSITVYINIYHEALLEYIIFMFVYSVITISFYYMMKGLKDTNLR